MAIKLVTAGTVAEALEAKKAGSAFLAGGTEVNRLGSSVEADTLVSIRHLKELAQVDVKDGELQIGALCTFQQLIESECVPEWLKEACRFMASHTKRNMATIGGNVASARNDSYLIPTLIAVGAKICFDGDEEVGILDYLGGSSCSAAEAKEAPFADRLITCVKVPVDPGFVKSVRYANTAQSHAVLTVAFAARDLDHVEMAAAVKNGGIYHLTDLAAAIAADHDVSEETLVGMVMECEGASFPTDMFGGEKYKRYLLGVTVAGLLADAKKGGLA